MMIRESCSCIRRFCVNRIVTCNDCPNIVKSHGWPQGTLYVKRAFRGEGEYRGRRGGGWGGLYTVVGTLQAAVESSRDLENQCKMKPGANSIKKLQV